MDPREKNRRQLEYTSLPNSVRGLTVRGVTVNPRFIMPKRYTVAKVTQ